MAAAQDSLGWVSAAWNHPTDAEITSQALRKRSETKAPWRNGRRVGLRSRCPKGRGSSTLPGATFSSDDDEHLEHFTDYMP